MPTKSRCYANVCSFPCKMRPINLRSIYQVFALGLILITGSAEVTRASNCTISGTASQTVKGWGSFPSYFRSDWSTTHQDDMFDKPFIQDAVFALGITHIRVDVEPRLYVSGSSSVSGIVLNQTAVNDLVQQIQIARNHGVANYIMSCWTPPAVWKDNGSLNGGHLVGADEPYYVNYYIKVIQTLQAAGVGAPVGISVQNEPDLSTSYDSCIYTDSGTGYALWRQLVKDMRAALDANGLSSVIVFGPECTSTDNDINLLGANPNFGILSSDPTFNLALGAYASHTYGENIWLGMRSGMRTYPKDAWITEWSVAANSDYGGTENGWTLGVMAHMASNFVDIPYNYWTWWVEWAQGSAPQGTTLVSGTNTPVYSERYWVMQKLFTAVRPGWAVHSLTCDDSNYTTINTQQNTWETQVDLVSFWNPAGNGCVTMLINKTSGTTSMTVHGLVGASYSAFQSDATHNMANVANGSVSGGVATISLAPTSVTLLVTSSAPQGAISGLEAVPANPGVTLSWPISYGANGYNVKRATTSVGPYTTIGSTTSALSYTDTTAVAGSTYYYVVTALNPSGEGPSSNPANILVPYLTTAVADAYVQDGSAANTNYGSAVDAMVKLGPTGYNRQAYYRFNVSGLANAYNAQIWLMPDITGATIYNTNPLVFEWLQNDTWSESTITWSNRPAGSGTNFANGYTGYFAGKGIALDVTSRAKSQATVDGLLSLHIYSNAQAPNGDNWIQFATKENTTAGYTPVLAYTLQPTSREPYADAYVRDGSYSSTNYGTDPDLLAKADAAGYNRESYLTFDVSDLASAPSVKLVVTPDTVGTGGSAIVVCFAVAANDTWTESGVTWNNKPGSTGSPFTTLNGGFVSGQPVAIDVTSQAHAAAAGDGLLSIRIYATNAGSNNWVTFGSRNHTNASYHPVLQY